MKDESAESEFRTQPCQELLYGRTFFLPLAMSLRSCS